MVRVLLRETASPLTFIMNVISVDFIACFLIICWFLQTLNYRGNEKYVLVLVQCHDGMIMNSINLVCVLHSSSTRARPNRFISFVIIASWHWTRTIVLEVNFAEIRASVTLFACYHNFMKTKCFQSKWISAYYFLKNFQ